MTTIISGFNPPAYEKYAKTFLETFDRYWPTNIKIMVYVEENVPKTWVYDRIVQHSLWDCRGQREFIEQNKDRPERHGRAPVPQWGRRDERSFERVGYTFRYDAVRFSRQLFIPEQAAKSLPDGEVMVWFDADVVTFDMIPDAWVERLIGFSDICTLGRDGNASDMGFWAVRLNELTRKFLFNMAQCCRSGEIFSHNEWHSGYIFDRMIERLVNSGAKHTKLTNMAHGHVWFECELGNYTDHLKGEKRKEQGRSSERPQGVRRQEPTIIRPCQQDLSSSTPGSNRWDGTNPSWKSDAEPSRKPTLEPSTSSSLTNQQPGNSKTSTA